MEEKLLEVLECDSISDYAVQRPSRIYTYLLNDTAEEFKTKPILLNIFTEDEAPAAEKTEKKAEKKGFFASLFGKKK